jgi:hypothetical protein
MIHQYFVVSFQLFYDILSSPNNPMISSSLDKPKALSKLVIGIF